MNRKQLIIGLAGCAVLALSACLDRNYDNPFLSDSDEISEEWKRDLDGNGIADSVETYARNCNDTPAECLRQAKENAAILAANLSAGKPGADTIPAVIPPKDTTPVVVPPKDSTPVVVPPKDTTPVVIPPKDTTPVVVPPKDTTPVIIPPMDTTPVVVPPRDTIRDTIVVPPKVTAATGIEAQAIYIPMGVQMARPSVSILPRDAANQGYTLQSLDETTVKVSGMDLVPVKPGTATIKARSDDGGFTTQFQATVLVTDTNRYETAVSVASMELVADAAAQAPVITWTPANVTNRSYSLTSSDPGKVLVVMEGGVPKCKPIAAGKADMTLTTLSKGLTAVFTVTVKPAPILTIPVLAISAQDLGLVLGGSDLAPEVAYLPLLATNRGYTLKSDNINVVSVSGAKLHAVAGGNANITITSLDGPSSVFKAGVTVRATAVSAADQVVVLGAANFTPAVTFTPASTTNKSYTLRSDAPTVVSVVGNQLHAGAGGTATILLTSADGPVATFKVTVTVRATSVSVGDIAMDLGSPDVTPAVSFVPAAATNKAYTLKSASPGVVSVSGSQLHAVSGGTSVITVTAADGPTTTFKATVSVALTAISAEDIGLIIGGADAVPAVTFTPAGATNKSYSLSSATPTVVSVVGGRLHAVAAGTAIITITSAEGPKSTFTATAAAAVTPVTAISAGNMAMLVGAADASPTVAFTPAAATNKSFTLTSGDPTVVTVVGTKLHAVAAGSATITITSADGPKSTFTVTVTTPVTPVTAISAGNMAMVVGSADASPTVAFTPATATDKSYTLTSSAPTVVSVIGAKLHAVAAGSATITITSADGPKSTFTATVTTPVTLVTAISAGDMDMLVGSADASPTVAFTPAAATNKGYTLASATPSVVSVIGTKLHAVAAGTAIITITSEDGPSSTFTATVSTPVTAVTAIAASDVAMVLGGADATPAVTFTPANATNKAYTLASAAPTVVSVVGNKLHAVAGGTATITVTSADGPSSTFTATVEVPVTEVTAIGAGDVALVLGGANVAPAVTFTPANATHKAYTLTSEDPTVVSVVGTQLHAVAGGKSVITVTSVDGPSSTFDATVKVPVQAISAPDMALEDGDKVTVVPVFTPANADNTAFTMTSDSASIVGVKGHDIEAKKQGVAIITLVAADGGATSTFTVTVTKKGGSGPDTILDPILDPILGR